MLKSGREKPQFLSLQGGINKSTHTKNTRNSVLEQMTWLKHISSNKSIITPTDIC